MPVKRKQIRQAVRDLVAKALPTMPIFTQRFVDAQGTAELVTVYLSQGDTQPALNQATTVTLATLSVCIYGNLHGSDDELDDYGDLIQQQLDEHKTLNGLVHGLVFTGFEYPMDDEPMFSQLILNFSVQY